MASSLLGLCIRMLFAFLCLSSTLASSTVPRSFLSLKQRFGAVAVSFSIATSLGAPLAAHSVPLGLHSGCAYPACTSQIEILQSSAPGLVANEVKVAQVGSLKDIQFALTQLSTFAQDKDYAAIRSSLRSQPAGSLRITARKVRNLVPADSVSTYSAAYSSMLEDVDDVDSLAGLRLRGESSDQSLSASIQKAQGSYKKFIDTVDRLVEYTVSTPATTATATTTASTEL